MSAPLRASKSGLLLSILVQPGARSSGLGPLHDGRLRVRTQAAPEKGQANAAVERLLAEAFELPRRSVSVVSGASSRKKDVALEGLSLGQAQARLEAVLSE